MAGPGRKSGGLLFDFWLEGRASTLINGLEGNDHAQYSTPVDSWQVRFFLPKSDKDSAELPAQLLYVNTPIVLRCFLHCGEQSAGPVSCMDGLWELAVILLKYAP